VFEAGNRARKQPPPPKVVFEALVTPDRDPARPWLKLLDDEQRPRILRAEADRLVVWSSLWPKLPDAEIHFELEPADSETNLRWRLLLPEELTDVSLLGHLRKRINELINGTMRRTFGQ
jgi:hypothetical protein